MTAGSVPLTYLFEVHSGSDGLVSQSKITGNGDTILAYHSYDGPPVQLHNRLFRYEREQLDLRHSASRHRGLTMLA
jgi:hypothetical protein